MNRFVSWKRGEWKEESWHVHRERNGRHEGKTQAGRQISGNFSGHDLKVRVRVFRYSWRNYCLHYHLTWLRILGAKSFSSGRWVNRFLGRNLFSPSSLPPRNTRLLSRDRDRSTRLSRLFSPLPNVSFFLFFLFLPSRTPIPFARPRCFFAKFSKRRSSRAAFDKLYTLSVAKLS